MTDSRELRVYEFRRYPDGPNLLPSASSVNTSEHVCDVLPLLLGSKLGNIFAQQQHPENAVQGPLFVASLSCLLRNMHVCP